MTGAEEKPVAAQFPIRLAHNRDLPTLQRIERSAGRLFAEVGMTLVADDEPMTVGELRAFAETGRAWVSTDHDDTPVAYLLADIVDGNAHIEQVSVHADYVRRSIGTRLLNHLIEDTRSRGLPAVTLTTYTEVAWNGPYYERRGFRYLSPDEETPGLIAIGAAEAAHGLDRWLRACMKREI